MHRPVLRVQGDIRQHVHRRFKHIQGIVCPHPMKAVGWPAAGRIALVAANGSPLVGVSGHTVFVHADEYGVVVYRILIQQLSMSEEVDHFPVNIPSQQIRVHPPHVGVPGRQEERFRRWPRCFE